MADARVAWSLSALTVLLVAVMVFFSAGREETFDTVIYGLLALAFAGMGALVVSSDRANRIGWLMVVMGVLTAIWETLEGWGLHAGEHQLGGGAVGEWVIQWSWIVDMALIALLMLLFPTGRLAGPRWRWALWVLGAGAVITWAGQALNPNLTEGFTAGHNPVGVDGLPADALFAVGVTGQVVGFGAGIVSLVVRFRRGAYVERQQIKWIALSATAIVVAFTAAAFFWYEGGLAHVAVAVALVSLPVAAGLAIFRHGLYDVDVVINRTVVYGTLTAILAGVYAGAVLLLQLVFSPSSGLAVAASTLTVATLFRPLRARVQTAVDRRFFRRRYDAQATLQAFASRVRDHVSLEAVDAEVRSVLDETVQPAHVSIWLRG